MSSSKNLEFKKTAFLNKSNSAFIEEMYLKFVNNDPELPDSWRKYFKEVENFLLAPHYNYLNKYNDNYKVFREVDIKKINDIFNK